MAVPYVENFDGDGTSRIFTVISPILSESHARVDLYYVDEGATDATDHFVPPSEWDIINNSIVFKTPPAVGQVVKVSVSSDGEGLDVPPSAVTNVAAKLDEVVFVANNLDAVTICNSIKDEIITVAGDKEAIESLFADKTTLDSLFTDKTTLDSLYNDKATLDSLFTDKATLDSLFADKTTLDSLYNDKATLDRLYASITNIDTTATHISSVDTVATSIANVNTIANNVDDVTYFADIYQGPKSEAPTTRNDGTPLQAGDLYFQTELTDVKAEMREYDADNELWLSVGSTVNGTSKRETFTAEADQTEFTITGGYDASYADVFLNGCKLVNGDEVDVSDGTKVVLSDGASEGDVIDVVAYGTFSVADTYSKAEVYNKTEADDLLDTKLTTSDLLEKIKEVDGDGSGLDADLLRGLPADFYLEVGDNYVLQRFPSGLIHLHCIFTSTADSSEDFTFPIAFPNNALIAHLTTIDNDGNADIGTDFGVDALTTTGFSVDRDDNVSYDRDFSIFVIGN